jgi:hypothetical protein
LAFERDSREGYSFIFSNVLRGRFLRFGAPFFLPNHLMEDGMNFTTFSRLSQWGLVIAMLGLGGQAMGQDKGPKEEAKSPLKFSGDLRLRWESNFKVPGKRDRHRQRMRFRLNLDHEFNEQIGLHARVRTGSPTSPTSPYQDLGKGFNSFDFNLSRLYVTYSPEQVKGLTVVAGKFGHPSKRNPVYGELVFDADLNPEGIAGVYSGKVEDSVITNYRFIAGEYMVLEQSGAEDAIAFFAEAAADFKFNDEMKGAASLAFYYFGDQTPDGSTALVAANRGNATTGGTPNDFTSKFTLIHPIFSFTYTGMENPLTVGLEFFLNTDSGSGVDDTGWALGIAYGSPKKPLGKFYYQYMVVGQDSVYSPLVQDDFLLATNFTGHVFGWKKGLMKNLGMHLWGSAVALEDGSTSANDDLRWRFRADFTFKF